MHKLLYIPVRAILWSSILLASTSASFAAQTYLEDADTFTPSNNSNMPSISQHLWPRIMMAETQSLDGTLEQFSKYHVIAAQSGLIKKVAQIQKLYPDLMYFRMFNPHEYLGFGYEVDGEICTQGNGIPFNYTTSSTGNCGIYAGHWLYRAGTTTTGYIDKNSTNVSVSDASVFQAGQYAVIYAAPAGSFNNAEHVLVTNRNTSNNTLTIRRAYKSDAQTHAYGSIIAQHVLGQSSSNNPENWVYNLGINGPQDSSGKRLVAYLANWLQSNYLKTWTGELTDAVVSGFLFDSDANFLSTLAPHEPIDMDNNLIVDNGISVWGQNWYLEGLEKFYGDLRSLFPNHFIVGGTRDAQGFESINGVQMEGFPAYEDFLSTNPNFERLDGLFAKYRYQSRRRDNGPAHTHVLSKTPSALFPVTGNPNSNQGFRFALGMTLLEDGYFVSQNSSTYSDIWFDEYAVDVTPGSSTYGHAIASNPNDESAVRAHTGWLGKPQGVRKRIYDDSSFAANNSLLQDGTFESNSEFLEWKGIEVSASIDSAAANVQDGSRAIRVSKHLNYQENFWDAAIRGPSIAIIAGRQYTFVFSAKATTERDVTAQAGNHSERFLLGPDWQRFVMSFTAQTTGTFPVRFNVGAQNTETWFDSAYLFEGSNPNIYRRDFDNGIVVVNSTTMTQTISLGGTFLRIKGTQQGVNNGASVSSVTLPPYDSALLVRPSSSSQPVISITEAAKTVEEGKYVGLTISANQNVSSAVTVEYTTRAITASSNVDFTWVRKNAIIPAGSRSVNIALESIDDTAVESNETFRVDLEEIVSGNASLGSASSSVITILDDDTPSSTPTISITPTTKTVEEGSYLGLTITANQNLSSAVTVEYTTRAITATSGADYTWVRNNVTIPAGSRSVDISIKTLDDSAVESNETFRVDLERIVSGSATLSASDSSVITIIDDDVYAAPIITLTTTSNNVSEGKWVNLTIQANRNVASNVTVEYTTRAITSSSADFVWVRKYAVIAAGSRTVDIAIQTREDAILESDETFKVDLDSVSDHAELGTNTSSVVTILDDETPPTLSFSQSLNYVEEGRNAILTIQSDREVQSAITVEYQTRSWTANANDFIWVKKNATIAKEGTRVQIQIETIVDDIADEPEEFRVHLNRVVSGAAAIGARDLIMVRIQTPCRYQFIPLKNNKAVVFCL